MYINERGKIPINYLIVKKTKTVYDEKKGKDKRVSEITKNQMFDRLEFTARKIRDIDPSELLKNDV